MSIEILLSFGGAVLAVVIYAQQMKSAMEQLRRDMMANFERHREEHQDHHKEIAKMFDGVADKLNDHVTEERVHNAKADIGAHCRCNCPNRM